MKINTDEKPYQCNQCKKSFRQSNHLVSHMRAHTDEKPYSCNMCIKDCSERCSLDIIWNVREALW